LGVGPGQRVHDVSLDLRLRVRWIQGDAVPPVLVLGRVEVEDLGRELAELVLAASARQERLEIDQRFLEFGRKLIVEILYAGMVYRNVFTHGVLANIFNEPRCRAAYNELNIRQTCACLIASGTYRTATMLLRCAAHPACWRDGWQCSFGPLFSALPPVVSWIVWRAGPRTMKRASNVQIAERL